MKPAFTHLHVHSHYSLLSALPKIPDLIKEVKARGMDTVALTDNCNLYGAIEFYSECLKQEVKPIIGIDAYVALRTRHDKESRIDNRRTRLILLAKNNAGYKNLIKLVTDAHLEGFYYKPRIDKELIEKYKDDLICIAPFFSSDISHALKNEDEEKATEAADFYKKIFGDDFYYEVCHHPKLEGALSLKEKVVAFAKKNNIPLVAAHDVYYLNPEDRDARKTLMSIQGTFGGGDGNGADPNEDFSLIDPKTAHEYFSDLPEALENTQKIADQCSIEIPLEVWKFPDYKIDNGNTPDEELKAFAYAGLERRNLERTPEIEKRIEYELGIISDKGYSKYFLAVADLLNFATANGILSNTRGSAAGSLVSYLTGITTVDPLRFRLPFERFLNPGRPSAPDIDMDFADRRRDEVIEYARRKYGKDHVAQIGTFGTMAARGAVRDTARAMGYDYATGDRISKLIPMGAQGFPMTIDRAMKEVPELEEIYKKEDDVKKILDMARKIEGCARHIGVHAAGVVISPDPLTVDTPIQWDPKGEGKLITQYDMYSVGEDGVGLLKFDFLGLKNLTIMGDTIELIKKFYQKDVKIDQIPLDDKTTYEMLSRGETAATFQLNGQGMTRFLKELRPNNIDDICSMVALYRPGPLAFIPDFIERKHNPGKVKYPDDRMKYILEPTFGILIYQDDVMQIAVDFAGYSWGEADKFRKAMGKKIPEVMAQQKDKFMSGCQEIGGLTEKVTQELWEMIETFAAYGFNKAHSASYGWVAYLTSYFKANYPVLYMTSVLTTDQGDTEKVSEMVTECNRMNIEVLPPDINESFENFTAVEEKEDGSGTIRFGLTTIKNFGEGIAHAIIEERQKNGPFLSLEDFLNRVQNKNLNKKSVEALAKSGALDRLAERSDILYNLEAILEYSKDIRSESKDQESLFGSMEAIMPKLTLEKSEPVPMKQILVWEKELLGLYISGHPLEEFKEKLSKKDASIKRVLEHGHNGATVVVAGVIETIKVIQTKKGANMAFVRIADMNDSIEVVVFPKTYEEFIDLLQPEKCIVLKGQVSKRDDEKSILGDKIKELV